MLDRTFQLNTQLFGVQTTTSFYRLGVSNYIRLIDHLLLTTLLHVSFLTGERDASASLVIHSAGLSSQVNTMGEGC